MLGQGLSEMHEIPKVGSGTDNAGTFWAFPHLHGHVIWSIARQIWSKRRLCLKAFGHSSATFFLVQKRVR